MKRRLALLMAVAAWHCAACQREALPPAVLLWRAIPDAPARDALTSIWGRGPNNVWAVGKNGTVLHWNGRAWSSETLEFGHFRGIWGSAPDDVWAVGDPSLAYHWNGAAWSRVSPAPWGTFFDGVWGFGPKDVWIATSGLLHWNGATWERLGSVETFSVWGADAADVWAVGPRSYAAHWDGRELAPVDAGRLGANAVHGTAGDNVWIVGAEDPNIPANHALHWDGRSWQTHSTGTSTLYAVWGAAREDAWAVGQRGTIVHWDGSVWTSVQSPTTADLFGVWGNGPADIWAVGAAGTILHYP